jgi:hypothetical protein
VISEMAMLLRRMLLPTFVLLAIARQSG